MYFSISPITDSSPFTPVVARLPYFYKEDVHHDSSSVSLLVKLKLSGKPSTNTPPVRIGNGALSNTIMQQHREDRISDGCNFIEKVLDKNCDVNVSCEQFIKFAWKQLGEKLTEKAEKRRVRERQAKLMSYFITNQQRCMKNVIETANSGREEESASSGDNLKRLFNCVQYHQTMLSSKEDKITELVVLHQTYSILGNKHRDSRGLLLPRAALAGQDSLAAEYVVSFQQPFRHFATKSHLLAINTVWQSSVQLISPPGYLECYQSYLASSSGTRLSVASIVVVNIGSIDLLSIMTNPKSGFFCHKMIPVFPSSQLKPILSHFTQITKVMLTIAAERHGTDGIQAWLSHITASPNSLLALVHCMLEYTATLGQYQKVTFVMNRLDGVLSVQYPGFEAAWLLQEDIVANIKELCIMEPGSRCVGIY